MRRLLLLVVTAGALVFTTSAQAYWPRPLAWYPVHHHHHRHHHRRRSPADRVAQPLPDSAGPFPKPVLTTIRGLYIARAPNNHTCATPSVSTAAGQIVGTYIDDTAPNLPSLLACAVGQFPTGIVLRGVSPNDWGLHDPPPVVDCYEAYPYGWGATLNEFLPFISGYSCYISQWWFDWGMNPVPASDRLALLAAVLRTDAPYVFTY